MKMLEVEEMSGRRGDYHVYYRKAGKLYVDAMWADTPEEAKSRLMGIARELRWKVTIEKVVETREIC